jgi:hypothetical protein
MTAHLGLVLRQRQAAETRVGRERVPGVDDFVRVTGDLLWIAAITVSLSGRTGFCLPRSAGVHP